MEHCNIGNPHYFINCHSPIKLRTGPELACPEESGNSGSRKSILLKQGVCGISGFQIKFGMTGIKLVLN
ncbi:MAG: hypothetical protein PF572_03255 [Patescibacteria group bacterium]|jgi:hypothetical protein|nr:hypothetical protein [Patescibacteria group bacterium]